MSLLAVENLSKAYGDFWAVNHVSFSLEQGQVLALIGPNGAGKTSTFNMIGGQSRANAGDVWFKADAHAEPVDLVGLSSDAIWKLQIGRTFQIAEVFSSLTVVENVQLALQVAHKARLSWFNQSRYDLRQEALALLADLAMLEVADRPASEIAYGDVKRLELAMALANQPRLLLMDEPAAGMSPTERVAMMALVKKIAQEREMAILFTEHSMDVVFAFADHIIVMAAGEIIASGTPDDIKENPTVKAVYLGSVTV